MVKDQNTNEVKHFMEKSNIVVSNLKYCGTFIFSVRLFLEYGLNHYPDEETSEDDYFDFSSETETPKDMIS